MKYNPNCTKCPLHLGSNKIVCLPGRGSVSSRALIVGEAPGAKEDETGQPFVGKSGEILTEALRKASESIDPFITNAAKCRPDVNATPTYDEIDACFEYLFEEVEEVDPVAIMTLGNPALYAITGEKGGITRKAGLWRKVSHPSGDPLLVMPNYHPAYIARNPEKKDFFEEIVDDFVKVWHYGLSHTTEETWAYAKP